MEKQYNFYIISLFESDERMENVRNLESKLKSKGYNVEIVPAYYYKTHDVYNMLIKEGLSYTSKDSSVSLSQVGCFLSHRECWKRIMSRNSNEVHVILEDDMDLEGEICNFNDIPSYDGLIMWRHPSQMNKPVTYVKEGLLNFYDQWGMCAYSLTPNFAKELVDIVKEIDAPIDLLLYKDIYPKKVIYVLENSPFINLGYLGVPSENYKYRSWIYS